MSTNPTVGLLAIRKIASLVGGGSAPVALTDTTEYTEDRLPAYNVFRKKDDFTYNGAFNSACATFDVVIRAMIKATSQAEEVIDPLIAYAWQQVMADESLGQIVQDAKITAIDYSYIPKGTYDMLAADVTVEITVDVSRSDPTQNQTYPN